MMRIAVIDDEERAGRHGKRMLDQQGFAMETFQAISVSLTATPDPAAVPNRCGPHRSQEMKFFIPGSSFTLDLMLR